MSQPVKVLVAEDDPEVREVISEYLRAQGFEVLEAGNGLEALLQVKRQRPHAVVLDVAMPRLGGVDALKRIRVFDPTIKVVVITGLLDPSVKEQALSMGAVAVFSKPVDLRELLSSLGATAAPSAESFEPDAQPDAARAAAAPRQGQILVVDDDPEVRATLEEFLALKGYGVRSAPDGAAAVRAIVQAPPDVVLLDIDMPGLSGVDALPVIRAIASDVRIIMVSGTSDVEISRQALARGAFDYVVKPIDLAYLTRSLDTAVAMKALGG